MENSLRYNYITSFASLLSSDSCGETRTRPAKNSKTVDDIGHPPKKING